MTIDANTPSTTGISPAPTLTNDGYGLITVSDPIVAATTGASSLTLTGAQIIIKGDITMRAGTMMDGDGVAIRGNLSPEC